ncbi:MAG: hypothetical protein ACE5E3_04045, partial [Mariprofundus sp.]
MVFRNHLMIRLLLLLFMATAGGALNAAEGDIYELLHSSSLRKGPDSAYESVAVAKGGEHATELTRRGKWVKVRMSESGDVGWLYAYSLELVAAGSSQAVAVAEQAPSAPDVEVADVLNGEDSSVRSEAGQGAGDSLFVDGSVSADAEAVGSDVSGTTVDGDVAAADLPGGDEAPVSEPIAADATDLKPDEEKVVIRSGGQTIIEAGALDDVGAI